MKNNIALPRAVFSMLKIARRACLTTLLLMALPVASFAQDTTSSIQGKVVDASGNPVAGATIVVRHAQTGRTQSVQTNAAGSYRVPNVRVGGPYEVTLQATSVYGEERVEQIFTDLGVPFVVNLVTRTTAIEEIVVTASQQNMNVRIGAGSTFDTANIDGMANVNRDFKNIIRQDPRVMVDPTNSNAISIAGTNNRFNSLTVDGVRQNDDFGLNNSGFPTQRTPISIDAIEQINVEISPFDVSYGGFTGGTINVVSKSGTNDWNGSLALYNSNDSLVGNKSGNDEIDIGNFDENTQVYTFSGPIIKDRLWFFAAYEKFTGTDTSALLFGPAGSGRPIEIGGVTQGEIDNVLSVAQSVYGIDAGALPDNGDDITDEKILVKLDWALNDDHDLTFTYQNVSGNTVNPRGSSRGSNRLSLTSGWYDKEETMETFSGQLFSRWTDAFSTEFKVVNKSITTAQVALGGSDYAEMNIDTPSGGTIRIGPDIFRQANSLANDSFQIKLKGEYSTRDHTISAGFERDQLEVFNLFVFASEGSYDFDCINAADCAFSLEAGNATDLFHRNAFTNDENDGAATFTYEINSLYLQDVWDVTEQFSMMYGLRYDWYTSDDSPRTNPGFFVRNGFTNTSSLEGRNVLMPRIGMTFDFLDGTRLRGGVGLFSGGNPNVWVSNSFSNDGLTIVVPDNSGNIDPNCAGVADPGSPGLTGIDPFVIDQTIQDCMFPGAGNAEATDPNFKIPSTWRYNVAVERDFDLGFLGDTWTFSLEAVISRTNQAVEWQELTRTQIGTAVDGRPIYDTPPLYDLLLTNVGRGSSDTYSVTAAKAWDTGAGYFDLFMAYTYMNAEDVNPGGSSTATSNYGKVASSDRNNRGLFPSDFEVESRFNSTFGWQKDFFGDSTTRISGFFEWRTGKPFSYTMRENSDTTVWGGHRDFARRDSQLMYVPSAGDPNVVFSDDPTALVSDPGVEADFNAFIAAAGLEGYRGQILPRNFGNSADRTRLDVRISQEIGFPGLPGIGESKLILFVDVENLGNMINNDWGRIEQVRFPQNFIAVDKVSINADGNYVYGSFDNFQDAINPDTLFNLPSLWKVQLGIKFQF